MAKEKYDIEDLGTVELESELEAKVNRTIAQADEEDELARVNFRWSREALAVVKQAAGLMGIPYQTFIKQTVFEHSLSIIKDIESSKKSA
jgi:predicted DNA binding CopG/RHH family protein